MHHMGNRFPAIAGLFGLVLLTTVAFAQDDILPRMVTIPSGTFHMGSNGWAQDYDEAPLHTVTISGDFMMSETPVTNAQYEQFRPSHREKRGEEWGISTGDDEAVVLVSWEDAEAYCRWLSDRTGKRYRLPTEAEWEYACRAGTYTLYYTGDGLDGTAARHQETSRDLRKVSLEVGKGKPNAFGLHDMHGLVEEWCLDWYGMYPDRSVTNPKGPSEGLYKVTRGGSHNTPSSYLRSASRMAAIPQTAHCQIGFRVVQSDAALYYTAEGMAPFPFEGKGGKVSRRKVRWDSFKWRNHTGGGWIRAADGPVFMEPVPYVIRPNDGTPFYRHNHQPSVTYCDNGDLLAVWFSCEAESGRDMVVLCSRLRHGSARWDEASLFFKVPDRNMTGSAVAHLGDGRLLHMNGVANSGDWQNLALVARTSTDDGASWTAPRIVEGKHYKRHQVISGTITLHDGTILQCCDAGPGGNDGTSVHLSEDGGNSWYDPYDGVSQMPFAEGSVSLREGDSGPSIAGIHAGIVELSDGSLMALGRGNPVVASEGPFAGKARMPLSISSDRGRTWTYHASPFPPIDGGQRLVLLRLREGPIMLVSFTDHPQRTPEDDRGMLFTRRDGSQYRGYGMYVALSYDEGKTWPVLRLLTDGKERFLDGGAWTGFFEADPTHSEPRGYLCGTQSPDGMIHILSSRLHYRFNLAWIENQASGYVK